MRGWGAAFALLLLLMVLLATVGLSRIGAINDHVKAFADNLVPSFRIVAGMRDQIGDIRRLESQHLLVTEPAELQTLEGRIDKAFARLVELVKAYEPMVVDDTERRNLKAVDGAVAAYAEQSKRLRPLSRQAATDPAKHVEARGLLFSDSRKAYFAVTEAVDAMWKYNESLG